MMPFFNLSKGAPLEIPPFEFDDASVHNLLDLGIRWYATDYPKRFSESVKRWKNKNLSASENIGLYSKK